MQFKIRITELITTGVGCSPTATLTPPRSHHPQVLTQERPGHLDARTLSSLRASGNPRAQVAAPAPLLYTRSHRLRLLQGNKDASSLRFPRGTGTAQTKLNQAAEKSKRPRAGSCSKSFRIRVRAPHGVT